MNDNHLIIIIIVVIIIFLIILLCMKKNKEFLTQGYYGFYYPYRYLPFYREMYEGNPYYIIN